MFQKNLKYYRLKNNYTKKELADRIGVTPMAITHYEHGDRRPDMETIKKLANVFQIKISDFLAVRNNNLKFTHEQFRKNSKLTHHQQEYIRESVEEYFNRFFEVVDILGGEVLETNPILHRISLTGDREKDGIKLREYLGINLRGPVGNLIEILENNGILIYLLDIDNDGFSGMNGTIDERPFIVLNRRMSAERIRTTIGHELAHIAFQWPKTMNDKVIEKYATEIAGAFLFPKEDAIRELGIKRRAITTDMRLTCKEYGIALSLLVMRAYQCDIINDWTRKNYFMRNNRGKNEGSNIPFEIPVLFEQLVYRAVNEEEISIQKGAELLKCSYDEVAVNCCPVEI